ncbi:hypothetical protein F2Q69_00010635 [Brassica cretica]|uniref:Uncharacterized protein n=1 Tax=Brassica cretica TaxID=69181 RepID=A0A8S9QVI3_BRACR|nr:hypothetical protein F2Q69_00010635 [Brassica cretica]
MLENTSIMTGTGVPHEVIGDIRMHLELKRGEMVTIGRTEHGSDLPERHHEVAVSHFSERPS